MKEGNDGSGLTPSADAARLRPLSELVPKIGNPEKWLLVYVGENGARYTKMTGFERDEVIAIGGIIQYRAIADMVFTIDSEASPAESSEPEQTPPPR